MSRTARKWMRALGLLLALCLLGGCRVRLTADGPVSGTGAAPGSGAQNPSAQEEPPAEAQEPAEEGGEEEAEQPDSTTRRSDDAQRKEYDASADAEITADSSSLLAEQAQDAEAPWGGAEEGALSDVLRDGAEKKARRTVVSQEAETAGVSEDGETAESVLQYYTVLLEQRSGSLFECKRRTVYWETPEDRRTVFRTSREHGMILQAGAYDVSARLLEENLRVDDGWVVRKDPGVIVKVVGSGVLGRGTVSSAAAEGVYGALVSRPSWQGTDAVRNGRVLLLSEEMLETPWLRTAAMLAVAKAANPELYEDVDPQEALQALSAEAEGGVLQGIWFYDPE